MKADLHTPDELLSTANELFNRHDELLYRAVVLEAVSALEAYVNNTVFEMLGRKFSPEFVKWLGDKTKSDFDGRLEHLTHLALEVDIASIKGDSLWRRYKSSKEIRNKVTHHARKVNHNEAKEVLEMVYDWLSFLGSTLELEKCLLDLKQHIEDKLKVKQDWKLSEYEINNIIFKYFEQLVDVKVKQEVRYSIARRNVIIDLDLKIGNLHTILEVNRARTKSLTDAIFEGQQQLDSLLKITGVQRGVLIICADYLDEYNEIYQKVIKSDSGNQLLLVIKTPF